MKTILIALVLGTFVSLAQAKDEAKEVTSKEITATGEVVCAHCDLKVVKKCNKAIKTKDGKAYLLAGDKVKAFFKVNKDAKKVTATGTTSDKDGKIYMAVSKIGKTAEKKG